MLWMLVIMDGEDALQFAWYDLDCGFKQRTHLFSIVSWPRNLTMDTLTKIKGNIWYHLLLTNNYLYFIVRPLFILYGNSKFLPLVHCSSIVFSNMWIHNTEESSLRICHARNDMFPIKWTNIIEEIILKRKFPLIICIDPWNIGQNQFNNY